MKTKVIKTSVPLIICRVVALLLLICTVGGVWLAFLNTKTTEDITEEERNSLLLSNSFRQSVRAMKKYKDSGRDEDDVIYIKHLSVRKQTITGEYAEKLVYFGTKNSEDDVCIDLLQNGEEVSTGKYIRIFSEFHSQGETIYSRLELEYIKELSSSDEIEDLLKDWRKEELKTISYVKRAIFMFFMHHIDYGYAADITGISVAISSDRASYTPDVLVLKFDKSDLSEPVYVYTLADSNARLMITTESMYLQHEKGYLSKVEEYTDEDIQMILEDMGVER